MDIRKFSVRFQEPDGAEREVEVLAGDEASARHVMEYINCGARTKVVGVKPGSDIG